MLRDLIYKIPLRQAAAQTRQRHALRGERLCNLTRVGGTEFLIDHVPDSTARSRRILEPDTPSFVIDRHHAQVTHINPFDPVLKVGWEGEAVEQYRQDDLLALLDQLQDGMMSAMQHPRGPDAGDPERRRHHPHGGVL